MTDDFKMLGVIIGIVAIAFGIVYATVSYPKKLRNEGYSNALDNVEYTLTQYKGKPIIIKDLTRINNTLLFGIDDYVKN